MPRVSPLIPSFNSGELSPWLDGRADFEQLPKGLRVCENIIPLIQGPATKRPGTRFVASTKFPSKRAILASFVFSDEQAYILEIGDLYVRFYTDRGQVVSGGTPYEVATPFLEADLPLLRFTQSADVLYFAHTSYAPRKLSRFAPTNWTLTEIAFKNGPFVEENIVTTAAAIQVSDVTGSVTMTASSAFFTSNMVGSLLKLRAPVGGYVLPNWEAGKVVSAGEIFRFNTNVYQSALGGTTGGNPPVHTEGEEKDGVPGVSWRFVNQGFGSVRITSVTDSTHAAGDVTLELPKSATTLALGLPTTRWSLGEWSEGRGYPSTVTFFGDRLYWAGSRTRPQTVWGSVVGDYENYQAGTLDDTALTLTINSSDVNAIRWMVGDEKGLLIGTVGGEWIMRPSNANEALTPFNAQAVRATDYGSNSVRPTRVGKAVLFVQRAARKLREFAYLIDVDGFKAPDMTVRADHISRTGFTDLAFQSQPNSVVWAPRVDGTLCGFTYEREQEATAWHRHILGGYSDAGRTTQAIAEAVAAIPSPSGDRDDLWLIVQRYVDGATVRYVEWLTPVFDHETAQDDAFFIDSGLTYDGAAATTISNLDHLEGETVSILADGAVHPDRTVTAGEVTLDHAASKVQVGLGFRARLQTERTNSGAADGTAQGKLKRIIKLGIRLYRTGGFSFGGAFDKLDEATLRSSDDPMGSAPALYTGDLEETWPYGWERDGCICIESATPTPLTILALMPVLETTSPG